MANLFQRWKAERRIPQEAYTLINAINSRYSSLNFDNGDFKGLSEREKLSKNKDYYIPEEFTALRNHYFQRVHKNKNYLERHYKDWKKSSIKLSKLIDMINNDSEIKKLNSLSFIGSIKTERQKRGTGIHAGSGSGLNLCIGGNGLFIYDWNDFADKHDEIPVNLNSLKEYLERIDIKEIREAVVHYTKRKEYIGRVADFNSFR